MEPKIKFAKGKTLNHVEFILRDGTVVKEPCRRSSGSFRAYFRTKEDAEKFATVHPDYLGDVAHLCQKCGYWHLSKIEWLVNAPVSQAVN